MRRLLTVSPIRRITLPFIMAAALVFMPKPASAMSYVAKTLLWGLGGAIVGTGTSYFVFKGREEINLPLTLLTWGAVGTVGGLGTGLLVTSRVSAIKKMEMQIASLQKEIDEGKNRAGSINNPRFIGQKPVGVSGNLPDKLLELLRPAEGKLYSVDDWTQIDDTHLRGPHKILELVPATINGSVAHE